MSKNYKDTGLGTFTHGLNLLKTGVSRSYGNYKKEREQQKREIEQGLRKKKSRLGAFHAAHNKVMYITEKALQKDRELRHAYKFNIPEDVKNELIRIIKKYIYDDLKLLHDYVKKNPNPNLSSNPNPNEFQEILDKMCSSIKDNVKNWENELNDDLKGGRQNHNYDDAFKTIIEQQINNIKLNLKTIYAATGNKEKTIKILEDIKEDFNKEKQHPQYVDYNVGGLKRKRKKTQKKQKRKKTQKKQKRKNNKTKNKKK